MAGRAQPLNPAVAAAGGAALAALGALTLGAVAVVALRAEEAGALRAADWRALSFTLRQAALSALLSVAFAIPVARALARRRFPGRGALTTLLGAPFLLPVIVAILGVSAVWGRSGWVSDGLAALGLPRLDIYGMPGVLIAHVFFNLPLAARLMLQAYASIPAERWRTAAQLGLDGAALFRVLEWPALRAAVPGALALVFSICATSFAVALTLGGGPRATTLELAIYEAAAFEFDLARAARLAALQFSVCAAAVLLSAAAAAPLASGWGVARAVERWDGRGRGARSLDAAALGLAAAFLFAPLTAVAIRGAAGLPALDGAVWAAAGRSLAVAVGSTALTLAVALPIAALAAGLAGRGRGKAAALAQTLGLAPLAASPFVIGIALFIVLRPVADPAALALPLTGLVNAAMATPYALGVLISALRDARAARGRLADSLGLTGATRFRALYWPHLRAPLGFAAGVAAALSAGDLGVIALFSAPDAPTLPLLMHLLAGSRNVTAAYGAAFVLVGMAFALFWTCDRAGRAGR
jgi:thiamine transport system permease protein